MEAKRKINFESFSKYLSKYAIVIVVVALFAFFSIRLDGFLTVKNVTNILRQVSIYGICAVGMSIVIITANIDLSQGSTIGLVGILLARLMNAGVHPAIACLIVLAGSPLIGCINTFFIYEIKLHPMITTLAMQQVLRAVAYLVSGGLPVYGFTKSYPGFKVIGQGYLGFLPVPVVIMFVIYVLAYIFLNRMRLGRYIYGVGSNAEAAKLSGINVRFINYLAFCISSLMSAIAGIVMLSRVNSAQPYAGDGYDTFMIIGSVLGGVSMAGGEGRIINVIFGVLVIGTLVNGMTMMNISEYWQMLVKGLIMLAAMSCDMLSRKRSVSKV